MSFRTFYKKQITVARIYGIPVRIDYRWFVVFFLSVWLIAVNLAHGGMWVGQIKLLPVSTAAAWTLAIISTLGLFLSVFGHELSHALMGRAEGIDIEEIVLHPFGGLARLRNEPDSPRAEFRIAVAGPAASFVFAVVGFGFMFLAMAGDYSTAAGVLFLISAGNLLLAVFNLFPGYPLDGGRVLRAILWHRTGDIAEATRMAGMCGMLIAGILIIFGVYMAIAPNFRSYFMGLWSVLVGLFLFDAASSVVKHARGSKRHLVRDAMSTPIAIEPDLPINQFIDNVLPLHRLPAFPVARKGELHGIFTLEDLKAVPRERWRLTKVGDLMRPIAPRFFVESDVDLDYARELMKRNGVGSVAVVGEKGELIGFLLNGKFRPRKQKKRE